MAKLFLANFLRQQADQSSYLLKFLWAVEGGLAGVIMRLFRSMSPDRASAMGSRLLRTLGPRLDKSRIIWRNLELAFPEKSQSEIEALVTAIWGNLGAVMAEYPHMGNICFGEPESRLEIIYRGNAKLVKQNRRPAVFVTAHLANWEISAGAAVWQGIPLSVIYTPIQNPYFNRSLSRWRDELRCGMIRREGAVRQLIKELKKGVSVGLLVDQRVDAGEPVPFFGRKMKTSITPAQLALRFNAALIPVQVQRREGARFRIIFHEPVVADDGNLNEDQKILQMTHEINAIFESWIRERPHEWFCSKRRWDKDLYRSVRH